MKNKNLMVFQAIVMLLTLTLVNYGFQYFNEADYVRAFERSFFQAMSLFAFVLSCWICE